MNSFGFGGTNAHAIIESAQQYHLSHHLRGLGILGVSSYSESDTVDANGTNGILTPKIFVLSSHYRDGTILAAEQLAKYLQESPTASTDLSKLAHTLAQRRSRLPWRATVVASSVLELIQALALQGHQVVRSPNPPRVGFVFTGQGANWHAMGRELVDAYPIFRRSLEMAERHLKSLGAEWSLIGTFTYTRLIYLQFGWVR